MCAWTRKAQRLTLSSSIAPHLRFLVESLTEARAVSRLPGHRARRIFLAAHSALPHRPMLRPQTQVENSVFDKGAGDPNSARALPVEPLPQPLIINLGSDELHCALFTYTYLSGLCSQQSTTLPSPDSIPSLPSRLHC